MYFKKIIVIMTISFKLKLSKIILQKLLPNDPVPPVMRTTLLLNI